MPAAGLCIALERGVVVTCFMYRHIFPPNSLPRTREMRACLVDPQIHCMFTCSRSTAATKLYRSEYAAHPTQPHQSTACLHMAAFSYVEHFMHGCMAVGLVGMQGSKPTPQNYSYSVSVSNMPKNKETRDHPKTHPTLLRSSRARERRGRHESRRRSAEGSRNSERVHHDIVRKFTLRDLDVVDRR